MGGPVTSSLFQEIYREVFAADPWVVDLRKKCPYFYSLGCHLSSLSLKEMPAVIATLENVFQVCTTRLFLQCKLYIRFDDVARP